MDKKKNKTPEEAQKNTGTEKTEHQSEAEADKTANEAQKESACEEKKGNFPTASEQCETEKLKAEAEDMKRKWYAVSAEYENYRKRTANESARRYAEGRADIVKGLFPIADNLELALAACADEATKKGISMVIASFETLLKEEKIEKVDPLGQPFDAEKCEAIMAVDPADGEESGIVKQVYRKGYMQGNKILRYAQVVVTK